MKVKSILQNYHWFVYVASVFYSLIKFKNSAEEHFFSLSLSDFEDGWGLISRPKDTSDFEWTVLTSAFKKYWPLLVFQIIISTFLRKTIISILPFFYSFYSILSLTVILGQRATVFILVNILIMFVTHVTGKKSICYLLILCSLIIKNSSYVLDMKIISMNEENESFLLDVALTWIMAKSLSFMCDRIDLGIHNRVTLRDISTVMSYCMYLPTVFTGPILSYEPFSKQICTPNSGDTLKITLQKVKHFIYLLFCYLIYELMLHFIYSSSVQYYPEVASEFDSWSLCGLGYALPVMFFFKYFLIYSMAGNIASFENFEFPPPPKCISCIHLSSYLWRHFDRGLYLWILRYLYQPLMQGKYSVFKKILALACSFAFVCLWHNIDKAICMWTFLNFLLVATEMLVESLLSSMRGKKYFSYEKDIRAAVATPLFIMMCISSIFFLSNWEIGVLIFRRVLLTGVIPLLPLSLIMFCGCKVSMDVREWEKNGHCYSISSEITLKKKVTGFKHTFKKWM